MWISDRRMGGNRKMKFEKFNNWEIFIRENFCLNFWGYIGKRAGNKFWHSRKLHALQKSKFQQGCNTYFRKNPIYLFEIICQNMSKFIRISLDKFEKSGKSSKFNKFGSKKKWHLLRLIVSWFLAYSWQSATNFFTICFNKSLIWSNMLW